MFERMIAWVKEHPYAAGGIAIVTILIVWYLFRGNSSGTNVAGDYYAAQASAAQNAAATNIAQTNAQAQLAGLNTQVAGAVAVANTQAGVQTTALADALAALKDSNATQADIAHTQFADALAALENTNATQLGETSTIANTQAHIADIAGAVNEFGVANAASVADFQTAQAASTSQYLANLANTTHNNTLSANEWLAGLNANLQFGLQDLAQTGNSGTTTGFSPTASYPGFAPPPAVPTYTLPALPQPTIH